MCAADVQNVYVLGFSKNVYYIAQALIKMGEFIVDHDDRNDCDLWDLAEPSFFV